MKYLYLTICIFLSFQLPIACMQEDVNKPVNSLINEQEINDYITNPKLHRWCTADLHTINQCVQTGGSQLFTAMFSNTAMQVSCPTKHLFLLKSICWFLYSLEPKFNNGTFVIQDPHQKLWNFFYQYFLHTTDEKHMKPVWYSTNSRSYARPSSHFPESQANGFIQIGIDSQDYDLPHGCQTMLVGQIDRKTMFIKPEKSGLYGIWSWARHAKGAAGSAWRKVLPKLIGRSWGESIAGSNSADCHRKEHLPGILKERYTALCIANDLQPQSYKTMAELMKITTQSEELVEIFNPLLEEIASSYSYPEQRFGNEVYLTGNELLPTSLYYQALQDNLPHKSYCLEAAERALDVLHAMRGTTQEAQPGLWAELRDIQKKSRILAQDYSYQIFRPDPLPQRVPHGQSILLD